ncbi:hypothetical protein LCGC14_3007490 [marine sediment metagenome]|uniref:HNH nuclease domain-containing protein n=1 Tax=marine sediment metagenome TaxID=412755 RepID=A0A0F8ZQE9_9ZZZZ
MNEAPTLVTPRPRTQEVSSPMPRYSSIPERFWSKVNKQGPIPEYAPHLGSCWLWTAGCNDSGYGLFWEDGKPVRAHRWAYEQEHDLIPEGKQLDHLCRTRHCIRASHLEPVTCRENLMRGDTLAAREAKLMYCPQGHSYDEENTYVYPQGRRECRECRRQRRKASHD